MVEFYYSLLSIATQLSLIHEFSLLLAKRGLVWISMIAIWDTS